MRILPLLLRPSFLGLKNRFTGEWTLRGSGGRDLIFSLFLAMLMLLSYRGTLWVLRTINEDPNLVFLPPAQPLSLFLFFLSIMVLLSGVVAAYDGLFQSQELDLLHATPLSRMAFFLGKYLTITIYASWMPLLLLLPVLIAFGQAYDGAAPYYLGLPFIFAPYFLLPSALSIIIALIFARFVPGNRTREIFGVVMVVLAIGAFFLIGVLREAWSSVTRADGVVQIIALFAKPRSVWIPSNWTALSVEQLLRPVSGERELYIVLSGIFVVAVLSFAYILFELCYESAFSFSRSTRGASRAIVSKPSLRILSFIPGMTQPTRALISKEVRLFSRELTQTVQLLMLCGLTAVYLYNLRVFIAVRPVTLDADMWYQRFLFIGNFTLGSFISIAACTRLVFPSLSLEGKSYWILRVAPVSLEQILRIKFWCWYIPVAALSVLLFVAGAFAVGVDQSVAIAYGFSSICIAYGVVGAATGLGAVYSNFDWEHSSQLAAGFGSLIYMLYSTVLIIATMVPTWFVLFSTPRIILFSLSPEWNAIVWSLLNCMVILAVNVGGSHLAIRWGIRELRQRELNAR